MIGTNSAIKIRDGTGTFETRKGVIQIGNL